MGKRYLLTCPSRPSGVCPMLIITRDINFETLLKKVQGKKVAIWTCRTCARLCQGLGGDEAVLALSHSLVSSGVSVVGVASTSASCLTSKVSLAMSKDPFSDAEIVISLTCDVAVNVLSKFTEIPILNCTKTWGKGYLDEQNNPILMETSPNNAIVETPISKLDEGRARTGPFV